MQASDPLDPRAVLGTVKAQPGDAEPAASQARRPALTAPARDAIAASAGRDEGTALGSNKGTARHEEQAMT